MNFFPMYKHPWGGFYGPVSAINRSLEKRITWITNCASVCAFYLITFDDWKTNKWKIFIEVTSIREYYVERGATLYKSVDLEPHSCYYLGQYPWHWNYENGVAIAPGGGFPYQPTDPKIQALIEAQKGEPWTGPRLGPYEGTTGGTGLSPELLENYDEDDFIFYQGRKKYGNYLAQLDFQNYLNTRLKKCIRSNYPPEEWLPKVKVKTPQGVAEWPGKPFKELDVPTPTAPKGKYPKRVIHLGLNYSPYTREDGLTLYLEIL
jgi:hypothetical protein